MPVTTVHVRNTKTMRVHKRFREEGSLILASYEGDNADSTDHIEVLTDAEFERVEADDRCRRCFPEEAE